MKFLFSILAINALIFCNAGNSPEIEHDVYITSFGTHYDTQGYYMIKDSTQAIMFTKDFWKYFIRTHPKASSMIFIAPLYDTSNHNSLLQDTSYTFYNIAHSETFYFQKLLADSITGHEKESFTGAAFFIIPHDTTGDSAKEERRKYNLKDYKITPTVEADFKLFKKILTGQDNSKHYVIVYKKNFANNIFQLYE